MKSRARSFRDPDGRLHFTGEEPVRQVYAGSAPLYREILNGPLLAQLIRSGSVVETRTLAVPPAGLEPQAVPGDLFLAHRAVPFASFPAEWPWQMLREAARLTLEIARQGLAHGLGLKDATPYNVLFDGARPVFVDLLSFERRDPCDPVWLAQGQFQRTFLLPLLANRTLRLPLASAFVARRDGMEPEELYRMLGPLARLHPRFLGAVSLPVWLSSRAEASSATMYRPRRLKSAEQARFVLDALFGRLAGGLERASQSGRGGASRWSDYRRTCSYDEASYREKCALVDEFLVRARPGRVLDIGANTGEFSRLAAARGAGVVALDLDAQVVGTLWEQASREGLDILPLVVDLARPTPAVGWCNAENPSFLERARGRFDAVFMLALVHHLMVTDQIPLGEVLSLAAALTRRHLVLEYVSPDDPQFRRLARGRDALYCHLTREHFEEAAAGLFRIEACHKLGSQGRWLYFLEKRHAG